MTVLAIVVACGSRPPYPAGWGDYCDRSDDSCPPLLECAEVEYLTGKTEERCSYPCQSNDDCAFGHCDGPCLDNGYCSLSQCK
jgi:hypothetical protein